VVELHLTAESEARLTRLASEKGSGPEQLVLEIVQAYLDHDQWFKYEVQKGLAQLDRGEFIQHEELIDRIERMSHSQ
jgi:predicted transcriptional regulator